MDIIVCVKRVPFTQEVDLEIEVGKKEVDRESLAYVINDWDHYALEEAVRLKEQGEGTVTAITLGPEEDEEVLRRCLAMGADQARRIDPGEQTLDGQGVARVLARGLAGIPFDLILCGVQAEDDNQGMVGIMLAEHLGLAHAAVVTGIEPREGELIVQCELEGGMDERSRIMLPALLTIQTGINEPRYVSIMGIKKAAKKPLEVISLATLNLSPDDLSPQVLIEELFLPPETGGAEMIGGDPAQVADNPRRQIPSVVQSGLSLPSRDYYLEAAEPYAGLRTAFRDHVASSFRRAGVPDADARAAKVLALEIEMARRQWTQTQTRDVVRQNRVMTLDELKAWAPGFDWAAFLGEIGYDKQPRIKVKTDTAVRDLAKLFAETPVADLQSYMLFHALDDWSSSLSDEWVEANFDFHRRKVMGVAERRPFELEAVAAVNGMFGEEIGRIYVDEYFPPAHRAEINAMVGYLRDMYRARITKLDWMDPPTKAEAIAKLDKVVSHIGYPERWHDHSSIRIDRGDLAGNQKRMLDWSRADRLKNLEEGTRDWEFPLNPQEVNAGYIASLNSVTFPAGILQPPYFDPAADPAVNFGAIVAVIGHEFGHAFDDKGSRSDGDGRIRDWWSAASRAEFEKRTAGLIEQFSQYEPVPGAKINGRQNLGENIGDLGGLAIAHAAYRKYVDEKQGGKAPVIDGLTGDQRFFLSWAQVWRSLVTESEERRRLLSDPHSPGEFRVNGIVRNVDAWYEAFDVKPGDKLYLAPEARVRIW